MSCASLAHESLNKDPTVWLDGAIKTDLAKFYQICSGYYSF